MNGHSLSRSHAARTISALSLVAFMAGCSGGSNAANTPTATSTATASSAPNGGVTTLQQGTGNQLVFSPTTLTINHGTTITVSNVSASTSHTFTITGQRIDITNTGGQSQQVTIDLPPGTYPFICRFHITSGMKGTLVVT